MSARGLRGELIAGLGIALLMLVSVLAVQAPASAADERCYTNEEGRRICTVIATDPGGSPGTTPISNPGAPSSGGGGGTGGSGGGSYEPPPGCTYQGQAISCVDPRRTGGDSPGMWSPGRSCYLSGPFDPSVAGEPWLSEAADPAQAGQTLYQCAPPLPFPYEPYYVWTGGAADPIPVVDPEVLAYQALENMALEPARVGLAPPPAPGNPESMAVVGMPMYMWAETPDETTWGPITRTASAGAVTVSATGSVSHSEWDMGDGTTVRCDDPGLAYEGYAGSVQGSSCTHTYFQTSADQPSEAYPISVTTYWEVEWNGGGQDGVIAFTLTNSSSLRVGEIQVIRTA